MMRVFAETGNSEIKTSILEPLRQFELDELARHKLLALAYSRGVLKSELSHEGQSRLILNAKRQALVQSLISNLSDEARREGLFFGVLKGPCLWGDIYRPGEREASDLDLYVRDQEFSRFEKLLKKIAFEVAKEERDLLSGFKTLFSAQDYPDLTIEVHSKLWWLEPEDFEWSWERTVETGHGALTVNDQLIHLCGHWAAQHTMISLHWLVDIVLFIDKHRDQLEKELLLDRSEKLKLRQSVLLAFDLARELFGVAPSFEMPQSRIGKQISFEFLRNPRRNLLRYFYYKHSTQDHWSDALKYDLIWVKTQMGWRA